MEQDFHDKAALQDIISLTGELEHSYRHALRSMYSSSDSADAIHYATIAIRLRELRRTVMKNHLPKMDEKDWCLCKSTACIRQLLYETFEGETEEFKSVEELVDLVWSRATKTDLSGCEACHNDIAAAEEAIEKSEEKID